MSDNIVSDMLLKETAKLIANAVLSVNTDYRGNLLKEVSERLYNNGQGFTGRLFRTAAKDYGINPLLEKSNE